MERRLAAILAADVVGYSRLMGEDEAGTLQAVKAIRAEVTDPKIAEHKGRVFKTTGDGVLVEFPSVVNAVACAAAIQDAMSTRNMPLDRAIQLRIGVNVGDVIVEGEDIFGDGVNVAARLEGIAPPGEVVVSATARDHLGNRLDLWFEDIGEQHLKNIAAPVRVFKVNRIGRAPVLFEAAQDRPSIAVLPFDNLSADPEQAYFADGMVEEIITALSRDKRLFVVARNTSFTYKGRAVDIKQVGRELGVRYVLEGSVRKSISLVRITAQLIDASVGTHLWADRFDGSLVDIFELQDQVTARVIGAISPKLEQAEIERVLRKPTESLDAYDHFLRGTASYYKWTNADNSAALSSLRQAIELDENFAAAHGMAARCYAQRKAMGLLVDESNEKNEAGRLGKLACVLGKDDPIALWTGGYALAYVAGDLQIGDYYLDLALDYNPNLTIALAASAWAKNLLGQPETAIERAARGMQLGRHDPQLFSLQGATSLAHYISERYTESLEWAEAVLRSRPNYFIGLILLAASAGQCDNTARIEEARLSLRAFPANPENHWPFRRLTDHDRWREGLRKAGLPE